MKVLYAHFKFHVKLEATEIDNIEDVNTVKHELEEWWTNTTEIPSYVVLEREE